jgi:Mg2+/Co2+ transporter CorB
LNDIPLSILFGVLLFLIVCSAFFSGSETSMMVINRYRLRHLAAKKHPGAMRVQRLLERPDRLIGVILLGNNFVNILASSIATVIAVTWWGDAGIPIAATALTITILLLSEVTPKTVAAVYPERIAYPASYIIVPLLKILYPLVWMINAIGNSFVRLFGISVEKTGGHGLSLDDLRMAVHEAEGMIAADHRKMLISLLDLEKVRVEEVMVPRNEIAGLDLNASLPALSEQLANCQHSRMVLYEDSIDHSIGILYVRQMLRLLRHDDLSRDNLRQLARPLYFIPHGTPLNTQLINFRRYKRRIGLVVNEYGDILGLVTMEDILEEIVGEFTTSPDSYSRDIHPQEDGSMLVDASITVRELNKSLQWHLPTDGPKTLNGLILNYLEEIPEAGTSLRLEGFAVEVVQVASNGIKMVRIHPDNWQPVLEKTET